MCSVIKPFNFILLSLVLFQGCGTVSNYPQHYDKINPSIQTEIGFSIGLGVQDRRNYVVSGKKSEKFIGRKPRGWGAVIDLLFPVYVYSEPLPLA